MSKRRDATTVLTAIVFAASLTIHASSSEAGAISDPHGAANDSAQMIPERSGHLERDQSTSAALYRQAPVGHRQPRADDIPADQKLPPIEVEMRHEDEMIAKKIIICRGC